LVDLWKDDYSNNEAMKELRVLLCADQMAHKNEKTPQNQPLFLKDFHPNLPKVGFEANYEVGHQLIHNECLPYAADYNFDTCNVGKLSDNPIPCFIGPNKLLGFVMENRYETEGINWKIKSFLTQTPLQDTYKYKTMIDILHYMDLISIYWDWVPTQIPTTQPILTSNST